MAEALAELQHNDAIGLQLVVDGKAPSSAACRAAGLHGTWRLTRWPLIRELDPEQLLANQQEQASTDAALEQGMADGVAQAQAERAERTQLCERHRQILLASASIGSLPNKLVGDHRRCVTGWKLDPCGRGGRDAAPVRVACAWMRYAFVRPRVSRRE